ncbi:MAG: glycerol-3-phosphate 1-O-acyltransferase PlsY [Bacteroidales bacterium]|nr:glycerol-3-phosphate 1-O-acyltransferase PlsY [Bacteroidales bacterium]
MQVIINIILILVAYLLGSIPTAVWIGKIFYGIDVREHGSGNAGSTNTFRVIGIKAGIAVFIIDVLKGWLAVNLIYLTNYYIPETGKYINLQLLLGIAAFIGHIFPVYVGFRGGKGVATLFGVIIAIHPYAALIIVGIFTITLLISKYVSLSSMIAGFSFPVFIIVVFETTTPSLVIFSLIIAVLLLFTHQKNIERLLKREENKANISLKKKKNKNNKEVA